MPSLDDHGGIHRQMKSAPKEGFEVGLFRHTFHDAPYAPPVLWQSGPGSLAYSHLRGFRKAGEVRSRTYTRVLIAQ